MTETTNQPAEVPRCHWGRNSDAPCWREAVVAADWDGDPEAATLCAGHERALRLGRDAERIMMDLDIIREFLDESMDDIERKHEGAYRLRDLLYDRRTNMEREYLEMSAKSKAAWRVADRGPDEEPLDLAEVERVDAQMIRADALSTALAILEDLPDGPYGNADRWAIAGVIASIERHPDEEAEAARERFSAEARGARRA
jgi:hypothetical protein